MRRRQLLGRGQRFLNGKPVPPWLLLHVFFGGGHAGCLPRGLLLLSGHGVCYAQHLLPRRLIQRWWNYVSNAAKLHCLRFGILPRDGKHHLHFQPLRSRLLLPLGVYCIHAERVPCWVSRCHALPCRNVFRWWAVVGGAGQLRRLLQHGLLPCYGQLLVHLQPVCGRLLLQQLLWRHAAGALPRRLLVRCGPGLGDSQPVRHEHVLAGWRLGHDGGCVHCLRGGHGKHARLLFLHAGHPRRVE